MIEKERGVRQGLYSVQIPFTIQELTGLGNGADFAEFTSNWSNMPMVGVLALQIQFVQGFLIPMLHIGARKAHAEAVHPVEREILANMVNATENLEIIPPHDMAPPVDLPDEEVDEGEEEEEIDTDDSA